MALSSNDERLKQYIQDSLSKRLWKFQGQLNTPSVVEQIRQTVNSFIRDPQVVEGALEGGFLRVTDLSVEVDSIDPTKVHIRGFVRNGFQMESASPLGRFVKYVDGAGWIHDALVCELVETTADSVLWVDLIYVPSDGGEAHAARVPRGSPEGSGRRWFHASTYLGVLADVQLA